TPAAVVTTLAGSFSPGSQDGFGSAAAFSKPIGVATDFNGNIYVADSQNHTIRKITPAGLVSTLAGLAGTAGSADGIGAAARFSMPSGIAVDTGNNVYVADTGNSVIRKITPEGVVSTLAGTVGVTGSRDGSGSAALFNSPQGITADGSGSL